MPGPVGGTNCKAVPGAEAREKSGDPEGGFEAAFGAGRFGAGIFGPVTEEETEEEGEEPKNAGRFGSEDGSVLWQPFIANRINNANP